MIRGGTRRLQIGQCHVLLAQSYSILSLTDVHPMDDSLICVCLCLYMQVCAFVYLGGMEKQKKAL